MASFHQRNVEGASRVARTKIEWPWRPEQRDAVRRFIGVERPTGEKRFEFRAVGNGHGQHFVWAVKNDFQSNK